MRAILLAAGRGMRLRQTAPSPKCLLRFGSATLLERHLHALDAAGVGEIVVAVGYAFEQIDEELRRLGRSDVETVMNPAFELGSVLTVHTTAPALTRGGDVLLMDADVLYDERIVAALAAGQPVDRLLIDREFEAGDEPVKVCLRNGVPVEFGKRITPDPAFDTIGESVGFFRFSEATARRFAAIVGGYVADGRSSQPHEEAIRDLLLAGDTPFDVVDVTGLPWIEIDFPEDIARANDDVLPLIRRTEGVAS